MTFARVLRKILEFMISMNWSTVLLIFVGHFVSSFIILTILGEADLINKLITFTYFYLVSASTVGYGDLSPSTDWGRLAVSAYLLPGANIIFMMIITKVISDIQNIMKETMNGLGNFEGRTGHFVIVGYQPRKTERLFTETQDMHSKGDLVIVAKLEKDTSTIEATPIKVTELSSIEGLRRAGVATAEKVAVVAEDDAETLAAALAISSLNPQGHVVAYFESREQANLLKKHCDKFEVVVSTSVEQVSRAMTDPGASKVFEDLSCSTKSATLLSLEVPEGKTFSVQMCMDILQVHGANMIGFRESDDHPNDYNVFQRGETILKGGADVYYIHTERLGEDVVNKIAATCEASKTQPATGEAA